MNRKAYFINLDGLRSIACLMVFSWHALRVGHIETGFSQPVLNNLAVTLFNGKNGVSIFFVLSGFLITYLILREINREGSLSLRDFYMRRILRIWPLYFLLLTIIFIGIPLINSVIPMINTDTDVKPVYYFTFLSNFDVLRIFETTGRDFLPSTITWSVAIEEQFYLVWPLLFMLFPVKKIQYVLLFCILIGFWYRWENFSEHPNRVYFHTLSAVFDLSVGGISAWFCINSKRVRSFFESFSDRGRILAGIVGLGIMYLNVASTDKLVQFTTKNLQAVFFATIIIDQCYGIEGKLQFSKSEVLTNLGKYTYGMYMYHPLILLVLNTAAIRLLGLRIDSYYTMMLDLVIGLPLTIITAKLSYLFIEKRFLAIKKRFEFQRKPALTP